MRKLLAVIAIGFNMVSAYASVTFTVEEGVLTSIDPNGGRRIAIPNTVTRIGDQAFSNRLLLGVEHITIPSSVKSISSYAFAEYMTSPSAYPFLDRSTYPGLITVDGWIVGNDTTLDPTEAAAISKLDLSTARGIADNFLYCGTTPYFEVIMPSTMTELATNEYGYANFHFSASWRITFPAALKKIDVAALSSLCAGMEEIIFLGDAPKLAYDPIMYPDGISDLTMILPQNPKVLVKRGTTGWGAVPGLWNGLSTSYYSEPTFTVEDGVLTSIEPNGASQITIPDTVTRIGDWPFINPLTGSLLHGIEHITIPSSVKSISSYAFAEYMTSPSAYPFLDRSTYPGLTAVDGWIVGTDSTLDRTEATAISKLDLSTARGIADDLWWDSRISDYEVIMPTAITELSTDEYGAAKYDFNTAWRVTFPATLKKIDAAALFAFGGVDEIIFLGDAPTLTYDPIMYPDGISDLTMILPYNPKVFVKRGTTGWGEVPGLWMGLSTSYYGESDFTIEDGVLTSIEPNGATQITIPDTVTCIGGYQAFPVESLRGVEHITMPSSVKSISWWAFNDYMTSPSAYPFLDRTTYPGLIAVDGWIVGVDPINPASFDSEIELDFSNAKGFVDGFNISSSSARIIHLPRILKKIDNGLMYSCPLLESVEIPESVESVSALAFPPSFDNPMYDRTTYPGLVAVDGWIVGTDSTLDRTEATAISKLDLSTARGIADDLWWNSRISDYEVIMPTAITELSTDEYGTAKYDFNTAWRVTFPATLKKIDAAALFAFGGVDEIIFLGDAPTLTYAPTDGISDLTMIFPQYLKVFVKRGTKGWGSVPGIWNGLSISYCGKSTFTVEGGVLTSIEPNGATQITIPDTVARIGDRAFRNALTGMPLRGIEHITIPSSVKSISSSAFAEYGTSPLAYPFIDRTTYPGLIAVDGWIVDNDTTLDSTEAAAIRKLDLSTARGIADGFSSNIEVIMPTAITELATIEGSVGFDFSTAWRVTFPASLKRIDAATLRSAFNGVNEIIFLGDAPTLTYDPMMYPDGRITWQNLKVYVRRGTTGWGEVPGLWMGLSTSYYGESDFTIEDGVLTSIEPNGATQITIPDTVTCIGGYQAFPVESLRGVEHITMPSSVKSISWWAFNDYMTSPSAYPFLDRTTYPGLIAIDGWIVGNDTTLDPIEAAAISKLDLSTARGIVDGFCCNVVAQNYQGYEVILPSTMTELSTNEYGTAPFSFGPWRVTFPATLKKIDAAALFALGGVEEIIFLGDAPTLTYDPIMYPDGISDLTMILQQNPRVLVKRGTTGWGAVPGLWKGLSTSYCGESKFTVEDGVLTSIKPNGAAQITIPDTVTRIGGIDIASPAGSLRSVEHITIPSSVKSISRWAFNDYMTAPLAYPFLDRTTCPGLIAVDGWIVGVDPINPISYDFEIELDFSNAKGFVDGFNISSSSARTIHLPRILKKIDNGLMASCPLLESVEIPESVESVSAGAFPPSFFDNPFLDRTTYPGLIAVDGWIVGNDTTLDPIKASAISKLDLSTARGIADGFSCNIAGGNYEVIMPAAMTELSTNEYGTASFSFASWRVTFPATLKKIDAAALFAFGGVDEIIFLGDAPTLTYDPIMYPDGISDLTMILQQNPRVLVKRGTTGWGVEIPGSWLGLRIGYFDEDISYRTVMFNSNGGVVDENYREVAKDGIVGELPIPKRDGYVFEGWWTALEGGECVTATTIVAGDTIYYAHWGMVPEPSPAGGGPADGGQVAFPEWTNTLRGGKWLTGKIDDIAESYQARIESDGADYEARLLHAAALVASLAENSTLKSYIAMFGFEFDYLGLALSGEESDPATWPDANELVDAVVVQCVPVLQAALDDLRAIPVRWTGEVHLASTIWPLDEDVYVDIADVLCARAGIESMLGTLYFLQGYDLTVDWPKARNIDKPQIPLLEHAPSMENDDGWDGALTWSSKYDGSSAGPAIQMAFTGNALYIRLNSADGFEDDDLLECIWIGGAVGYREISVGYFVWDGNFTVNDGTVPYPEWIDGMDWSEWQELYNQYSANDIACPAEFNRSTNGITICVDVSGALSDGDIRKMALSYADILFERPSHPHYRYGWYDTNYSYAGDGKLNRIASFLEEQTNVLSSVRSLDSLAVSKEWMRGALTDALAAYAAMTNRAEDGKYRFVEYDPALSNQLDVARATTEKALASLDAVVTLDCAETFGKYNPDKDYTLLPDNGVMQVYLGALFSGGLNRDLVPTLELDKYAALKPTGIIPDPTFGGVFLSASASTWIDAFNKNNISHSLHAGSGASDVTIAESEKIDTAVQSENGSYVINAKEGVTLAKEDVIISAKIGDENADVSEGYDIAISADGKTAVATLKPPTMVDVAALPPEDGAEKDEDDGAGVLVSVPEAKIAEKPTPTAEELANGNKEVGALPVKTVRGLYYQAGWGDGLDNMRMGNKVQATGGNLYLGVIKQTGKSGFYRLNVSEK